MLITDATLLDGTVADVRVGDLIEEVAAGLEPRPGEFVIDAALDTVIPGLHDHHVHLRSAAATFGSVRIGPPDVRTRDELARALATAQVGEDGWIRAIGYHDSVAGPLDRATLDGLSPQLPVRAQHRSGALWTFNTAALVELGRTDLADGRLHRTDATMGTEPARRATSLRPLSDTLAAHGVTGVTEATPGYACDDVESLSAARQSGELRQRLHCMTRPDVDGAAGVSAGPVKKILDDVDLDLHALQRWIGSCHDVDRPVAVHCVTDAQLVVTIAALQAVGAHRLDRIEHAAVVPPESLDDLARSGVTVVTQPNFIGERGDQYVADIDPAEHDHLWRVASLRRAGVPVALSTDLPFGIGDPWAAMRAAVERRTPSGVVLGADERVQSIDALSMFLGRPGEPALPRTVSPGQPGDLCILKRPPAAVLAQLDSSLVVATIVAGEVIWPLTWPREGGRRSAVDRRPRQDRARPR